MNCERFDLSERALRLRFCIQGSEKARLELAFKRRDKRDCFSIIHGDTGWEGR